MGGLNEQELGRRVGELFTRPGFKIPVLPVTALEVMRLSRQADMGVEKLIEVLSQDSMLAADILKLARSPVYAGLSARPRRLAKEAAVRLGNAGVHRIVLEAVQRIRSFERPVSSRRSRRCRKHRSRRLADLARVVARHARVDPDFGFLCGLLHEIGLSAGLMALAADKAPKLDLPEWFTLEKAHEEVAQVICHYWKLPPELGQVLAQHHAPPDSLSAANPMVSVLVVAEFLAEQDAAGLGHLLKQATGIDLPMEPADRRIDQARSTLRLDDRAWARLYEDAATTMANLDAEA